MLAEVSNLFSLVFAYWLPASWDTLVRMQVAMILSQVAQAVLARAQKITWFGHLFRNNEIVIYNKSGDDADGAGAGARNQLYTQIEDYLVSKYVFDIKSCELQSKRGDMVLSIYDTIPITFTVKTSTGGTIRVTIHAGDGGGAGGGSGSGSGGGGGGGWTTGRRYIQFSSTMPISDIQAYIKEIAAQKIVNNILTVYRAVSHTSSGGGRNTDSETSWNWEALYMKTNKTYHNTIYSEDIHRTLFDDVKHFIENEVEWSRRGIDYKRGYLLHGLPGTGKTSVAKILANMYELPVFILDVANHTDESLTSLASEINYFTRNKRYILLMEDLDRIPLFNGEGRQHYDDPKGPSIQAFLNVLDGMLNPFGRILIITGNDVSCFRRHPVAFRPGRIDKEIEFGYCTPSQIRRLIALFYGDTEEGVGPEDAVLAKQRITPAELVKLMQAHPASVSDLVAHLVVHDSKTTLDDAEGGMLGSGSASALFGRGRSRSRRNGSVLPSSTAGRRVRSLQQKVRMTLGQITQGVKALTKLEALNTNLEGAAARFEAKATRERSKSKSKSRR